MSSSQSAIPTSNTMNSTASVVCVVSARDGQTTRRVSLCAPLMKPIMLLPVLDWATIKIATPAAASSPSTRTTRICSSK